MKMKILDTLVSEILTRSPKLRQLSSVVNDLASELHRLKSTVVDVVVDMQKMQMVLYHQGQALQEFRQFQSQVTRLMEKSVVDVSVPTSKKAEEHKPN